MITGGNRSSKQYRRWIPDNEAVGLIICLESRVYYKNVDAALFDFKNRKAGSLVKRILLLKICIRSHWIGHIRRTAICKRPKAIAP